MSTDNMTRVVVAGKAAPFLPALGVDWLGFDDGPTGAADPFPQLVDYADIVPKIQGGKLRANIEVSGTSPIISLVYRIIPPAGSTAPTVVVILPLNGGAALGSGIPFALEFGLPAAELLTANRTYKGGSVSYNIRLTGGTLTAINYLHLQELRD